MFVWLTYTFNNFFDISMTVCVCISMFAPLAVICLPFCIHDITHLYCSYYVYLSLLAVTSDMYTIKLFMINSTYVHCNYNDDCHLYELLLLHKACFFVSLVNINLLVY